MLLQERLDKKRQKKESDDAVPFHWSGYKDKPEGAEICYPPLQPRLSALLSFTESDLEFVLQIKDWIYYNIVNSDDPVFGVQKPDWKEFSKWDIQHIKFFRAFFEPIDDIGLFIPPPFILDVAQIPSRIEPFLNTKITSKSLREEKLSDFTNPDSLLGVVLSDLATLLSSEKDPNAIPVDIIDEDKDEEYSNTLLQDLIRYIMQTHNREQTSITLRPNQHLKLNVEHQTVQGTVEFALTKRGTTYLWAWVEDKRLAPSQTFISSIAQRLAETIAIGQMNLQDVYKVDQEVFGISIRHYYISFWHAVLPAKYLHSLKNGRPQDFIKLKCYPASSVGFNLCEPVQRQTAVLAMLGLGNYLENGSPCIGPYVAKN